MVSTIVQFYALHTLTISDAGEMEASQSLVDQQVLISILLFSTRRDKFSRHADLALLKLLKCFPLWLL